MCLTWVRESRWNHYRVWKPLGLTTLAALTSPEWGITIFDENVRVPDYASLPRPDLVGVTAFTSQANRAYEVATDFRSRDVPVVIGGIHATMRPEEAVARVDSVVTRIIHDPAANAGNRGRPCDLSAANGQGG